MDSIMGFILRIGALVIFIACLTGIISDANMTTGLICGWCITIYAELEDIKEILKNDRITKHDCDRDRGSD